MSGIEVTLTYIKCALNFPGKKANLRLAVVTIFGGCAKRTYARTLHMRVLSDTKEILTILFLLSRPKSLVQW